MNKGISKSDSIEEKRWYKNTTAILAIISTVVIIVSGMITIFNSDAFKPKKVQQNIEIVLDRSADLHEDFDGITKINAIRDTMGKVLDLNVGKNENVALRQFGGTCNDTNDEKTQLLVDFSQDNRRNILSTLNQISISGQATLVSGIVGATSDFSQERFENVNKKIIVITGSSDACWSDAAEIIQTRLRTYKIDQMDFWFIGIGLPENQQMELENISNAIGGVVRFVNSNKDLEKALTNAIEPKESFELKLKGNNISPEIVDLTAGIINNRTEILGVKNARIYKYYENSSIIVDMPSIFASDANDIFREGRFEIRIQVKGNNTEHILYGDQVIGVGVFQNEKGGSWGVPFELSDKGAKALQDAAIKYGVVTNPDAHYLSMYLDNNLLYSAPLSPDSAKNIQSVPLRSLVAITGSGDSGQKRAKELMIYLRTGALPVPVDVKIVSSTESYAP